MSSFPIDTLIWPTCAIFLITLIISFQLTKWPAFSLLVAFFKAGIFFVYFGLLFDGLFTFLDDWTYLNGGKAFVQRGIGITNLSEHYHFVLGTAGGNHFLYYIQNSYALRIFGNDYWAPVALNVIVSVGIASLGARLAVAEFGMGKCTSKLFYLFLLFHPDILAWSNIMNGKDTLVLFFHVMLLACVSQYIHGNRMKAIILGSLISFLCLFLRFYVPLLFGIALSLAILISNRRKLIRSFVFCFIAVTLIYLSAKSTMDSALAQLLNSATNPIFGFFRMFLTPVPFRTEEKYSFLDLPALIHWMLVPFLILGIYNVWKIKRYFAKFFIFYFLIFLVLYSCLPTLQGPRHRVQLDFAIAVFQFIGLLKLYYFNCKQKVPKMKLATA